MYSTYEYKYLWYIFIFSDGTEYVVIICMYVAMIRSIIELYRDTTPIVRRLEFLLEKGKFLGLDWGEAKSRKKKKKPEVLIFLLLNKSVSSQE